MVKKKTFGDQISKSGTILGCIYCYFHGLSATNGQINIICSAATNKFDGLLNVNIKHQVWGSVHREKSHNLAAVINNTGGNSAWKSKSNSSVCIQGTRLIFSMLRPLSLSCSNYAINYCSLHPHKQPTIECNKFHVCSLRVDKSNYEKWMSKQIHWTTFSCSTELSFSAFPQLLWMRGWLRTPAQRASFIWHPLPYRLFIGALENCRGNDVIATL